MPSSHFVFLLRVESARTFNIFALKLPHDQQKDNSMANKVFISTADDPQSREYAQIIKTALWRINDFSLTATTLGDVGATAADTRLSTARAIMDDSDIFIGVYGAHYGDVPPGETASYIELEYQYAMSRGLMCMVFFPQGVEASDERLIAFKRHLQENHVISTFNGALDLQAQVLVGVSKYKLLRKPSHVLRPPSDQTFSGILAEVLPDRAALDVPQTPTGEADITQIAQAVPAANEDDQTFTTSVLRAFDLIDESIEDIVRRTLEVHDARRLVQQPPTLPSHDTLHVRPLFGAPSTSSQFNMDLFMIMPFREQYTAVYDTVIVPTLSGLNLTIKRGDDFSSISGAVIQEVWAAIYNCRMVIAEVTEINANVYYELGIAHTLGKPAVLITQTAPEELPFDIRHLRFITYENTIDGAQRLATELKQSIIWILNDLKEAQGGIP